jgi:hypothetical protein
MSRAMTSESQPSRRLPPPEAWRQPDKYIDLSTGLALGGIKKIQLQTDDRKFVMPDVAVKEINETFFWPDYDWPFNPHDPCTCPDDHHFHYTKRDYQPHRNHGSLIPLKFRELPTMIGRMPRQFHNTIHDFTYKPLMPKHKHMAEYNQSYHLAYMAFQRLYRTASRTVKARQQFNARRRSVQDGFIIPQDPSDTIAEDIMKSDFVRSFTSYSEALDLYEALSNKELVYPDYHEMRANKPDHVVRTIGKLVNRQHINYTPLIAGTTK